METVLQEACGPTGLGDDTDVVGIYEIWTCPAIKVVLFKALFCKVSVGYG